MKDWKKKKNKRVVYGSKSRTYSTLPPFVVANVFRIKNKKIKTPLAATLNISTWLTCSIMRSLHDSMFSYTERRI